MQTISPKDLEIAADLLRRGELVAFPTETVYGLGAALFCPQAVRAVFRAKGRPADNPLIAHVATRAQAEELSLAPPSAFYRLVEAAFPGPLTLIIPKHPRVPDEACAGQSTIAVRMPSLPLARALIARVGQPLVAPSANLSGRPSATRPEHVMADFTGKIAGVVMGGPTEHGIESTVLSLVHSPPCLLRPGSFPQERIEAILGEKIALAQRKGEEAVLSPGMKYRHYAPRTPIFLFRTQEALFSRAQKERRCMVLSEHRDLPLPQGATFFALRACDLYAHYLLSEERGDSAILILAEELGAMDPALRNRILLSMGKLEADNPYDDEENRE